ncbi:phage major capsid protein, HK97 [Mycolicibacterium canariasense]|uniref:Phage major capsid protein, HK97 n=1 Tax=Mycolicibacterium canariasense TaxID=228230 RepID=A0A100WC87_MYCCR|nr:phage major capsid protein [Mycolicibacterium canariasense]MCV7212657.1 phage major capsid protein [Mycolicibacterium canariasense]ORV02508.1 capsid protein [Mycolicibacterium canariasense]GAS95470.1 phage major capsid protein, HK97 [Mycolicibacterium canariasense]
MSVELTHQQALHREKDIQDELERLKAKNEKTAEDRALVAKLLNEFREVHAHRLDQEHDAALDEVRSAAAVPAADPAEETRGAAVVDAPARVNLGGKYKNPWDLSGVRYDGTGNRPEMRSRALDCIEKMPFADDKVREVLTKLVQRDGGKTVDMVLAATSPLYGEAFTKIIRSEGQMAALTGEEQHAISRAMSLTDSAGGFLVPPQLDANVILTANGSVNQVRQISRVVTVSGDSWTGVTSAGVTASWDAEAAQVSDDSPSLASPNIPVYKGQAYVQVSHEVAADAPTLANEIATMVAFEKDRLESVAFVTGSGSGEPTGIITALVASSPSVIVNSATTDTFALADVYALDSALPARFAANASWLAHRATYNLMRRFDTAGGAALWGYLSEGRKSELLGRPDYVAEAMDGAINTSQENYNLVYGDFSNFVIVDRLGTTMRFIPDTFGANGRPTGQSGWLTYWRVGSDSVNDAAFRLLNVT